MKNNNQQCSHLEIEDNYSKTTEHLKKMLNIQSDTQKMYFKNQNAKQFKDMSLAEIMDFWSMNTHAILDEIHEATDALGGINDGIGNAVWKRWKANNSKASKMTLKDLSADDLIELKFEIIDILHFFMNYWISIGATPEEMYNMYISKNQENYDRQENNY